MHATGTPTRASADRGRPAVGGPARPGEMRADRRHFVHLLTAGAVGAFSSAALAPRRADAADGAPLMLGSDANQATAITSLTTSGDTALAVTGQQGYGIDADGYYGNARFFAAGDAPLGNPAWAGTLWVDGNGDWWASTRSDDADGQWRKLAGAGTAGALHVLPTPVRVYDSRPGQRPATVGTKSPLAPDAARPVDATQAASGVPVGARAALVTLTATGTGGPGFVAVWPSGAWPETSTVNFGAAGQTIATTTVVGLVAGTFLAQSNTTTDVIVDIVGYYQ